MSGEFHQEPGSQGEDRGEELNQFGQAPEAGNIWESGEAEEGGAGSVDGAEVEGDVGEAWDNLGAVAPSGV